MDTLKLGQIIKDTQHKDAIHIAVAPLVAAEPLHPGQHVGIVAKGAGQSESPIGVVDPYLKETVQKGQKFWLFLYPGSITALRHEWTHPAFHNETPVQSASEAWLRTFAVDAGISYEDLLEGAAAYVSDGEYLCQGERWEGFSTPAEFWDHYEAVTGTKVSGRDRGSFFTCSC